MPVLRLSGRLPRLAAVIALLVPLSAAPGGASVFNPQTTTLDNGMRVVVIPNHTAPVVTHMVWYGVGAADEAPGKSGIAHFVEHLMFRGTADVPDGEFSAVVARNGGVSNAYTSWDFTAYFQEVAADRLPLVMELEADRMANLDLREEIVNTERSVIIEERRQRIDNRPSSRLSEGMLAALYRNHPYGIPIIGWEHEMAGLNLSDAQAFYETWYAPNNAVLVVSGDVDLETVRALAEDTYGQIPPRPVPERIRPQEPERGVERRVTLRDPQVQQPDWRRYYLAPGYHEDDGAAHALQVFNELFGAGTRSRLYRSLVLEDGLAVGAGSSYDPHAIDRTLFGVFITPHAETDLAALEAAYDAEVDRLLTDGVTEDEVAAARTRLLTAAVYARDSVGGPAHIFGRYITTGTTETDVEAWPERIAAVSAEDIMQVARTVLDHDRSVTGVLLPAAQPQTAERAP